MSVAEMIPPASASPISAPGLEALNVTKRFGSLLALDNVSMTLRPGTFHALLGGNGAGKSTLVKCIMGYYQADSGTISINGTQANIRNPREAHHLGIGMVYQHFTLVPNMTVAENLVLSRGDVPMVLNWKEEFANLRAFMKTTPFFIDIRRKVSSLSAGEKQKLELCKQLYLQNKILFLDEPTSVLTPQEADEVLGMIRDLTLKGALTALMITHKFREVMKFADEVTVLRAGKFAGKGMVKNLTPTAMAEMMIGAGQVTKIAARGSNPRGQAQLHMDGLHALDETGAAALEDLQLTVHAGEIVGIAGVSGNGQSELVEVLAGQRRLESGKIKVHGESYSPRRSDIQKHKIHCLPEEPLKNTCVGQMSVAQNMAFRTFDRHPFKIAGLFLHGGTVRSAARELIKTYRVKTPSGDTPIRDLSGGNVQRAVLARELASTVEVLVAANPCFGLDFEAAADIRAQIIEARNRGAAVLLVSEDLDEVFELSDRIVVMFDGKLVYETTAADADIAVVGRHMAGHGEH
ncbi:MAG: ABC transporter ATP-binding protein [Planctomycetota bacterium]|nr:ABC transporter ATP-binding protein [Planctomycetota bacterium]